eukprot:gnl/TRDRNA2_/TRDRNA2_198361_c0_seq1.p1 gnl/TRDRNA2_/TRDRNA2_198361_c0~~gnl/TRDRNA2_/TRDRNA2_198361_c0_seq1.p1  ORF type:complete len:233 (+),score=32.44 gnl/TRDRNA2_/TRDRNA2_198361_c0_seq1:45-743(+)
MSFHHILRLRRPLRTSCCASVAASLGIGSFAGANAKCEEAQHSSFESDLQQKSPSTSKSRGERFSVAGYWFDNSRVLNEHKLIARGVSHIRYWGVDVCAAVLYLPEGVCPTTGEDVMNWKVPKQLEVQYLRSITGDLFRWSTRRSIESNGLLGPAAEEGLGKFNPLYRDVQVGDRYTVGYDGGRSSLSLNDKELGGVDGREFSVALFSVWFGDFPFHSRLKDDLLKSRELAS